MRINIFNGAGQVDYLYGLVSGLAQFEEDTIDVLDADLTRHLFVPFRNVRYHAVFNKIPRDADFRTKARNSVRFYSLQIGHLLRSKRGIVHFQWLDRFILVDRIFLPLLARIKGHKVVVTVHNINAGKRDNRDSWLNRFSLATLYRLSSHLIVHTEQSKAELLHEFPINPGKVSVIKHGMNNRVFQQGLSTAEARKNLGLKQNHKVILFFGNIDSYKGLDLLIDSLEHLNPDIQTDVRLVIAGNSKVAAYTQSIKSAIEASRFSEQISSRIEHIPDDEVEQYFMAADCIVLPYRNIYQSGVIFMAYTFGLPIIVSDIGNFRNDMVIGKTGLLLNDNTPEEIGKEISAYFGSHLFLNLPETRQQIKDWAWSNYSWQTIGAETRKLYQTLKLKP
ncbi:MAG: glycosyltransferase [Bacteroidales bacterium]|nr:glycosyltransferase [Bacteroidales bacterium]